MKVCGTSQRFAQCAFAASGFFQEVGEQLFVAFGLGFLQFAQRDIRIDCLLRADEPERGFGNALDGTFEQTFIDVADLFHIKRLIREQ